MPDKTVVVRTLESSDGTKVIYPRTSVNAIYKDDGTKANVVVLDENGKIPVEQLPEKKDNDDYTLGKATNITVQAKSQRVFISWTDPEDLVIGGTILSSFKKTVLRRKEESYPENPEDGDLIIESTIRNQYSSTPIEDNEQLTNNTIYYYKLFTYNTNDKYNNLPENQFAAVPQKTKINNIPSPSGTLIYNGMWQTPTWNNYNPDELEKLETSQVNAGSYTTYFTPTRDYCWSDGTTIRRGVVWTIQKATGTLNITPSSIALNNSNLSQQITITTNNIGEYIIEYTSPNGLTITRNGQTFTIAGDGTTPINSGEIVFTIKSNNYTDASKTLSVSATYWEFGDDGEEADANWFAGLQYYLQNVGTGTSLRRRDGTTIIGATKRVTLTSSVLGTTSHLIRVIGVDQDASNTVTWQTANCLNELTTFGSTPQWSNLVTAMAQCQNYANAFPLPSALKQVQKRTCSSQNANRNGTANQITNTLAWLPSEREMGIAGTSGRSPLSESNSSVSNSECTKDKDFSYQYYSTHSSRQKTQGDNGDPCAYWERSRHYNPNIYTNVCAVNTSGAPFSYDSLSDRGLAPAFVIG